MTTKVLVSGDVRGDVQTLFTRVATLHATKGPFDCLFCVGDFFGALGVDVVLAPYRSGEQTLPLRTYILGPPPAGSAEADADGKIQLCPELYCLTGAGILTLHGLRVAFTSNRADVSDDVTAHALTEDVSELRARASERGFIGCDMLLTHEWPRGFFRHLPAEGIPADLLPDKDLQEVGVERIAELAAAVRPRYHFCASENAFFARPPFRQPAAAGAPAPFTVSRFVSLADVGNSDKKNKWLHALSLAASIGSMSAEQLTVAPENTTATPYPYAPPPPPAAPAPTGGADGGASAGPGGQVAGKRKRPEYASDSRSWVSESCWFCMASAQFESHLVVSVGEEVYVCLAKGPLLPTHALILPIAHVPCSLFLSAEVNAEVDSYVAGLRRFFESRGCQILLFERFMGSGSFEHAHIQALPIPSQLAPNARAAFEAHGRKLGIAFEVLPPGETVANRLATPEPFFSATLPSGEVLLHRMATSPRKHPLQFGREAVAAMLGNPRRADWKNCLPQPAPGESASTQELEGRMTDDFKAAFASFDPMAGAGS